MLPVMQSFLRIWFLALTLAGCSSTAGSPGDSSTSSDSPEVTCAPGHSEACYTASAATRDVGACRSGVHICQADGHSYGDCAGEVVPQPESCRSTEDLDCNGAVQDCTGVALWTQTLTGTVTPIGIAASPDGEVTVAGWAGEIDVGMGSQGSDLTPSLFVARLGADGSPRWLRTFGGFGLGERPFGLVMNAAHEATVVVDAAGPVLIDDQIVDASPSGVLAFQLDDAGALAKAARVDLGDVAPTAQTSLVVRVARLTADGGVVVGGAGFVAQLDAGLGTVWQHRYLGDIDFADLTVAANGHVIAAGDYREGFEPGGGAPTNAGPRAGFLAELDGSETVWSTAVGALTETKLTSVVVTLDGKIIFGGVQGQGGNITGGSVDVSTADIYGWRLDDGALTGLLFGWGDKIPAMSIDASGDLVSLATATPDDPGPSFLFKSYGGNGNPLYWMQTPSSNPPVFCTLPTGETFLATPGSVQKLAR